MTCPINHKTIWDYLSTLAPIGISLAVVWIAWCQYRTNNQKLKLDLYNRRFAIYEKTLSYYLAYKKENDAGLIDKCSTDFVRAYRESVFLFGENSPVYKALTEIKDNLGFLIQFDRKFSDSPKDKDQYQAWSAKKNALPDLEELIPKLERALMEWLDFRRIKK
jgi:hypothetical protein